MKKKIAVLMIMVMIIILGLHLILECIGFTKHGRVLNAEI